LKSITGSSEFKRDCLNSVLTRLTILYPNIDSFDKKAILNWYNDGLDSLKHKDLKVKKKKNVRYFHHLIL
jgi:hypothetical protein